VLPTLTCSRLSRDVQPRQLSRIGAVLRVSSATMPPPPAPIDRVLARLAKRTGYEPAPDRDKIGVWRSDCPIRHAEVNTLTVKTARDGRVLLLCSVGCSSDAIAAALDFSVAELFPVPPDFDTPTSGERNGAQAPDADALPSPIRASDIEEGEPVVFSVADLITAGDFGLIAGEDGSMKTTLALHLAGAIAGGYRAFGRFAVVRGPVLCVSEEDDAPVIRNRLEAMCRGHGWDPAVVLGNVHVLAKTELRLNSAAWRAHLTHHLDALAVRLLIVDPLAEVSTGEENSNSDGRADLQALRSFARPSGANVLVIHHFGKPMEGKRLVDRIRGNTAIKSGSRFTYAVEHDDAAKEITVTCVKLSRAPKLPPFVVRYIIQAEPENRAVWTVARFDYVDMREAKLEHAELFVLKQLGLGERMNTTELKKAATGSGVSGEEVSKAIKVLEMARRIDFVDGPSGSKLWGLFGCREDSGNPGNPLNGVAGQAAGLPGKGSERDLGLPAPLRGQGKPARDPNRLASSELEP
jgi:hypothetical protein